MSGTGADETHDETAEREERERRAPYRDVLREYPREERRRLRREFRAALETRAAEAVRRGTARRRKRRWRDPLVNAAVAAVSRLPLGAAAWFGERVGGLLYRLSAKARHRVIFHMVKAFGETRSVDDIARTAHDAFRLMGRGVVSLLVLHRLGPDHLHSRLVEVEGAEHLDAALAEGKGVLVVGAHFGLFEVAGSWIGTHRNGIAVGRDTGESGPARTLINVRDGLGCPTIERGDARAIVRALRENRPVAIVADHDVARVNGVFVPFFGELAHTPVGPAALAARTGAPIVQTLTEWTSRTTHRVRFFPPMRPRDDLPKDQAIHELTYRFTHVLEEAVRERPAHWLWLHKRWETRPESRPDAPVYEPGSVRAHQPDGTSDD